MGYFGELQSGELNKEFKDIHQLSNRISMGVTETQDAFIFQTLRDFAANQYQIVVEKQELMQAMEQDTELP